MYRTDLDNGAVTLKAGEYSGSMFLAFLGYSALIMAVVLFMLFSIKHVTVQVGNKTSSFYTFAPTVAGVIREIGVTGDFSGPTGLNSLDEGEGLSFYSVSEDLTREITDGMHIRIYQNRLLKTVRQEQVAPPVRREWDIFLEPGKQRIINPGQNGLLQNTFLVHYRDGVVVSEEKVKSLLVAAPRPKIVACGSYEIASRGVGPGQGPVKFISTAYTWTGHRTAIGAVPRRGIVAVDPRVVRLGTRMYIEGYGYAVAADTGGVIKGRKIDVYLETNREAVKWGRKKVNVYFL